MIVLGEPLVFCHGVKRRENVADVDLPCLQMTSSIFQRVGEHDYIAFAEYYNEPIGRSFGNCDIYNTTITWLC